MTPANCGNFGNFVLCLRVCDGEGEGEGKGEGEGEGESEGEYICHQLKDSSGILIKRKRYVFP